MIPKTAGSSNVGDDSTGMGTSFNGISTLNVDASLRAFRTCSQERTQYQIETKNPQSQTAIKIVEIGFAFGATVNGIATGAAALKGTPISTTVEIGRCVIAETARHSN